MDAASYMALTADNFLEWKTVGERDTDRQHCPGPSKWPSQNSFVVNVSIKSITSGELLLY